MSGVVKAATDRTEAPEALRFGSGLVAEIATGSHIQGTTHVTSGSGGVKPMETLKWLNRANGLSNG
ncbi:hypothetical protein MPLDJ20_150027 [Mesorhizobium plurifarium]|uniref:Uncharacterized protein n=1 Tax=Mesorhizobium plurifarium TaxID=69974 RepID=A0A090EMF2_MESPL|nr:hypothetical protein MPLDJ20_150027 [Mesorhizobium plurifarium]